MENYLYIFIVICFFTLLYIRFKESSYPIPVFPVSLSFLLCIFVVCSIAFYPVLIYGDKYNYLNNYNTITLGQIFTSGDIGWAAYTYLSKVLFNNSTVYFSITAVIYVAGYYVFARKNFPAPYVFVFLLACFCSFGFMSYGVNTLRAGFSMSLLLLAFSYHKKTAVFIIVAFLSVLCHKSMALPLIAFIITKYYNEPKVIFRFWFLALIVSFINIGFISEFIQNNMGSFDERTHGYLNSNAVSHYNSGFRVDFIVYSLIPILVGYFYIMKLKISDEFYIRLFNTYIIANSFWLLVIRMEFTDRMAYLSWFLIPYVLLYPLLKYKLNINQKVYVGVIVLVIITFTTLMSLK